MADKEKKCINCKQFGFYKLFASEGECKHSTMTVHPLEDACDKFEQKQSGGEPGKAAPISAEVLKQIMWERDQAMEQLEANGLRFGHKDDYGWIYVSERLPENNERVLYCYRNLETGEIKSAPFIAMGWWVKAYPEGAVAWRPLPQPCKEEIDVF